MNLRDVAERLTTLETERGQLTEKTVVEDARSPDSPLHGFFEWDDTRAAEAHRLSQARLLIRRVRIEVNVREVPLSINRYVRDPEPAGEGGGYRNIINLRSEADIAREVVVSEMNRLVNAVKRAKQVAMVLGVSDDLSRIEEIVRGIENRISLDEMPAAPAQ